MHPFLHLSTGSGFWSLLLKSQFKIVQIIQGLCMSCSDKIAPKALLCSFLKVHYDLLSRAWIHSLYSPSSRLQVQSRCKPHHHGPGLPVLDATSWQTNENNMKEDMVCICPHLETKSSNMFKTNLNTIWSLSHVIYTYMYNERRTDFRGHWPNQQVNVEIVQQGHRSQCRISKNVGFKVPINTWELQLVPSL